MRANRGINMDKLYSTKELIAELRKRQGVKTIEVKGKLEEYFISTSEMDDLEAIEENGPATILIIKD